PFRLGSLGFAGALAQPFLQFFASPLGFSRCLLRRRQLAAEFLALFLLTAPFLFKLLAPLGFFPASCLTLRSRCFRLLARCFRPLHLFARFLLSSPPRRSVVLPFRLGSLGFAVALAQPFLQFFAPPLGFSRCLLLRRQLAAEFLALLLQTGPFAFESFAPLRFFPARGLRFLGRRFCRLELSAQLRLQTRSLSVLLSQLSFGVFQLFLSLAHP